MIQNLADFEEQVHSDPPLPAHLVNVLRRAMHLSGEPGCRASLPCQLRFDELAHVEVAIYLRCALHTQNRCSKLGHFKTHFTFLHQLVLPIIRNYFTRNLLLFFSFFSKEIIRAVPEEVVVECLTNHEQPWQGDPLLAKCLIDVFRRAMHLTREPSSRAALPFQLRLDARAQVEFFVRICFFHIALNYD